MVLESGTVIHRGKGDRCKSCGKLYINGHRFTPQEVTAANAAKRLLQQIFTREEADSE